MDKKKKFFFEIKRFFWLSAVFVVRIIFAPRHFKVPILKGIYYNICGGFTSDQVYLYNLNKKNKKDYLSEFDWYKSRKINYPNSYMLNNKLIFTSLVKDYIKVPITYFKKENGFLYDNNERINIEQAIDILKNNKNAYFKPISIGKGKGIFRIDYKDNDFYIDFKKVSFQKFKNLLEEKNDYFLTSLILQDDYLNKIYDKTSNTIRLIVARHDNDDVEILCAVQRIGTKDTIPVDNGSRGGLIAKVDLDTGMLSEAKSLHNNLVYKNHPDSKGKIEGVIIPNWDSIKQEMLAVSKKLKQFKFIAWDLLPTKEGICVIEANASSGVNIIQVFGGERNKKLGLFYKEQKIIK